MNTATFKNKFSGKFPGKIKTLGTTLTAALVLAGGLVIFGNNLVLKGVAGTGATLILIVLIAAIFWFLHIRILRPLNVLSGMMTRLAGGDADFEAPGTERKDEIGDMARAVAVFRSSLAERKGIERALVEAKEKAVLADHAKSDFLANMSHELRTPLNAVIGFSEIMIGQIFGPMENKKYAEYIESIHTSGQHLLSLVNDILDITAIEAGKLVIREEQVNLGEISRSCIQQLKPQSIKGEITLEIRIPDTVPMVRGDGLRLKQALLNLAANAVKFTPKGGLVTIAANRVAGEGIVLSVTDTGIGIAQEDLSSALEPFGQINRDAFTTGEGGGVGLGLFLCRLFAEMHGGSLEIESTPDTGTRAMILLPEWRVIGGEG